MGTPTPRDEIGEWPGPRWWEGDQNTLGVAAPGVFHFGMTKLCKACGTLKSAAEFSKNTRAHDGLQASCKECQKAARRALRAVHAEIRVEPPPEMVCSQCGDLKPILAFGIDKSTKHGRRLHCRDCDAAMKRVYHAENGEVINAKRSARYFRDPVAAGAKKREYKTANRPLMRRIRADRRARELQQTLPLTIEQKAEMLAIYEEAAHLARESGVPHHVDHIVPLRGKLVWGLHVPWNLTPLPAAENLRKSSKFEVG